MIRILIEEGDVVLVDALVDVPNRRVVSLALDDARPLEAAYIAEAVLSGEMEALDLLRGNQDAETGRRGDLGTGRQGDLGTRPEAPTCEGGCE